MLKICIIVVKSVKSVIVQNRYGNVSEKASNLKTHKVTNKTEILDEFANIISDNNEIANIFNTFFVNV